MHFVSIQFEGALVPADVLAQIQSWQFGIPLANNEILQLSNSRYNE